MGHGDSLSRLAVKNRTRLAVGQSLTVSDVEEDIEGGSTVLSPHESPRLAPEDFSPPMTAPKHVFGSPPILFGTSEIPVAPFSSEDVGVVGGTPILQSRTGESGVEGEKSGTDLNVPAIEGGSSSEVRSGSDKLSEKISPLNKIGRMFKDKITPVSPRSIKSERPGTAEKSPKKFHLPKGYSFAKKQKTNTPASRKRWLASMGLGSPSAARPVTSMGKSLNISMATSGSGGFWKRHLGDEDNASPSARKPRVSRLSGLGLLFKKQSETSEENIPLSSPVRNGPNVENECPMLGGTLEIPGFGGSAEDSVGDRGNQFPAQQVDYGRLISESASADDMGIDRDRELQVAELRASLHRVVEASDNVCDSSKIQSGVTSKRTSMSIAHRAAEIGSHSRRVSSVQQMDELGDELLAGLSASYGESSSVRRKKRKNRDSDVSLAGQLDNGTPSLEFIPPRGSVDYSATDMDPAGSHTPSVLESPMTSGPPSQAGSRRPSFFTTSQPNSRRPSLNASGDGNWSFLKAAHSDSKKARKPRTSMLSVVSSALTVVARNDEGSDEGRNTRRGSRVSLFSLSKQSEPAVEDEGNVACLRKSISASTVDDRQGMLTWTRAITKMKREKRKRKGMAELLKFTHLTETAIARVAESFRDLSTDELLGAEGFSVIYTDIIPVQPDDTLVERSFEIFDTNNDGSISWDELMVGLARLIGEPGTSADRQDKLTLLYEILCSRNADAISFMTLAEMLVSRFEDCVPELVCLLKEVVEALAPEGKRSFTADDLQRAAETHPIVVHSLASLFPAEIRLNSCLDPSQRYLFPFTRLLDFWKVLQHRWGHAGLSEDGFVWVVETFFHFSNAAVIRRLFRRLDKSAGDELTFRDILVSLSLLLQLECSEDKLLLFFSAYDLDGDGKLGWDDLLAHAKAFRPEVGSEEIEEQVRQVLARVGTYVNPDLITFNQFSSAVLNNPTHLDFIRLLS
eukprot:Rmarinus@m.11190